jgi:hypothetical protein
MSALLIGCARCSTDAQDLTAQRDGPATLGADTQRIYVDRGLTGMHREPPGSREALVACRAGDTLVVLSGSYIPVRTLHCGLVDTAVPGGWRRRGIQALRGHPRA